MKRPLILALVLALTLFNARKKLPFLPLASAATWMQIHIYLGWFSIFVFLLHIHFRVPHGLLEATLAGVFCLGASQLRGAAALELAALRELGIEVAADLRLDGAQAVVDAIFGTGLSRRPDGKFAAWIEAINSSNAEVIAVDVPSGLDADTGLAYAPCVRANKTVTLGLPKPGLLLADGPQLAGEVWVVDIGVPFEAYAAVGVEVPPGLFSTIDRFRLKAL